MPVWINEIHYDDNGASDSNEVVEIAGTAGTDLTGWTIVLYNGSNGTSYDTDSLSGTIPNQSNGFGTVSISYPTNGMQNGSPDGIALVDNLGNVVQFLSYEGTFTATNGPASGMTSVAIPVGELGTATVGTSMQLQGSGSSYADFTWATGIAATSGAINNGQTFVAVSGLPTLSINDVTQVEGDAGTTSYIFTVSLSAPAGPGGVTFDIATADGVATAADNDYVANSLTGQTIPAGSDSYAFTVIVNGDTAIEPNESFFVNVTNVTGATVTDGQGLGTITNDDLPPTPSLSVSDVSLVEGQSGVTYANFTVSLSFPHSVDFAVDYASANGTAAAGSDYLGISGTLIFHTGETSKTLSVPIIGDTTSEPNETFTINLSNAGGGVIISDGQGLGTITNDEPAAYFALSGGNFSENWTDIGRITTNDNWSNVPHIVGYLGDIDAAVGEDPRGLTGPNAGAIDVIANMSAVNASGGVGEFHIANPTIGLQGSGTADAPSIVLFMDASGRTDVRLTANLRDLDSNTDDAAQSISVQYRTDPAGQWINVPGGYFPDVTTVNATPTTALDVILPAGANNSPTLQIRIMTVNASGSDEWVGIDDIVVSSNQGPPSYSIADAAAFEGQSGSTPIAFTVTRAGDTSAAGTVDYAVTFAGGGFSASGNDFASALTGSVSFNAGETSKTFLLDIQGDALPEADEGFTVTLSNPSSGNLGDASATGTIVNDDGAPPFVTISDVTQAEGDAGTTTFTFTVTRTGGATPFSVDYATQIGSAGSPGDFAAASGTLNFAIFENSKTISITVNGDTVGEHAETFNLVLSNPVGAVIADEIGTGTILNDDVIPIYELQGAGHVSTFAGEAVKTQGIVTAVDSNGFYIQAATGDGNHATSDAILVFTGGAPTVAVGDFVTVTGTLTEFVSAAGALSITEINAPTVTIHTHGNALPEAVLIGTGGRTPPTEILDDDGLTSFDPSTDGLDFYESLEGMRVTIDAPLVVANTNGNGETWVVASGGAGATGLNSRFGMTISGDQAGDPTDFNPERIQIDDDSGIFAGFNPNYTQGDRLTDVTGILGYSFSSYEVVVTEVVTVTEDVTLHQEVTALDGDFDHLTIASYNVENLDPGDSQTKFDLLADDIVFNLSAPDIIGLQEVQDANGAASGPAGDFSGTATAQKLIDAIVAAGGPVYSYIEVAPTGSTGGEGDGHIHQGFLYNAGRVSFVNGSALLIGGSAYSGSRNPLVADFVFNSQTVTLINVHFTARSGSDPLMGSVQPPENAGDAARTAQAQGVADYIAGELATNPALKLGVIGDFNGFYFEDVVGTIEAEGLTDLHRTLAAEERYSYLFDGNYQAIDHMLVTPGLFTGALYDAVHLNSEFSNNASRPTDHDSSVARFTILHPDPVILPSTDAAGTVTELADMAAGENATLLSDGGTIFFQNPDASLSHTATVVAQGGGYIGAFTLGGVDQASDSVGWSFSVADAALNALSEGEVVTQRYTVTLDDGRGGSVAQIVEIDLVGSNDTALLSSANIAVEQGADPATASGALTIADEDDGEAVFLAQTSTQGLYGDFTIDAAGQWSYVADQVYSLGAGEFRSDVFTVLSRDGTPTTVAVTITGPDGVALANQDMFFTTESQAIGAGLSLFADNGSGPDSDPDSPLQIAAVEGDPAAVGHSVLLASGARIIVNADGTFSYDPNGAFDYLTGAAGADNRFAFDQFTYTLAGGTNATVFVNISGEYSPGDSIGGNVLDNNITGSDEDDTFLLQQGGTDSASGEGGDDGFYFGAAFDNADAVDGGDGTDTLALQGDVDASLDNVGDVEVILAMSGSDPRFGDAAGNLYSYALIASDGNVDAGEILTVIATDLLPGENLYFDGSAESDGDFRIFAGRGDDDLTGGAGDDGFFFGADGNLTGADFVEGGAGTDTIALRGNYVGADAVVFQDGSFSGVEVVAFLSGLDNPFGGIIVPGGFDYDVTMADGNVGAGTMLDINGAGLGSGEDLRFDGRAESNGSFRILAGAGTDQLWGGAGDDLIHGGLGADALEGGAGADTYWYRSAAESTSLGHDSITGFDSSEDRIDAPGGSRALSQSGSGTLSTASFDADLAAGLDGVLGAGQAALFAASAGSLAGRLFAVIDVNGSAGYQAGEDLVIELVDPVLPIDPVFPVIV